MPLFPPVVRAYVSPTLPGSGAGPSHPQIGDVPPETAEVTGESADLPCLEQPADKPAPASTLPRPNKKANRRPPDEPAVSPSSPRFALWLLGRQGKIVAGNAVFSLLYFLPGTLSPYLLGRAVDQGVTKHDIGTTVMWASLLAVVVLIGVAADMLASTFQIAAWLDAMYRVMKLISRKVGQMCHVIIKRVPAGEMLSVASSDADTFGALGEVTGRVLAALASFGFVTALVLTESTRLGLVVLASAPVILILSAPIMVPMQRNQRVERERASTLTGMAVDIVSGLRILRGVGGERIFGDNYARQSRRVVAAGKKGGYWWALFQAVSTVLTGCLLVLLTWLGINEMLAGRLTVGQLISFFGYAVFLGRPFGTFVEFIQKWLQALVSARKTIGVFNQQPPWHDPDVSMTWRLGDIRDEATGFTASPGQLTIIVSDVPDDSAALADRIGRYLPIGDGAPSVEEESQGGGAKARRERRNRAEQRLAQASRDEQLATGAWGVSIGNVDLASLDLAELRQHVMVTDASAAVFAGTLQHVVDPHGNHTRQQAEQALWVASADDVWEALPDGWQGRIDERGRGLSGGQRQRLILARSLLVDPEVLVLVEPTSAVDAHTEARIAERLPGYRAGRTTIMTTVSPLWLRHADRVVLLDQGSVIAAGTHADLMKTCPAYRSVVIRDSDQPPAPSATQEAAEGKLIDHVADELSSHSTLTGVRPQ